jgi:hypothetical protein
VIGQLLPGGQRSLASPLTIDRSRPAHPGRASATVREAGRLSAASIVEKAILKKKEACRTKWWLAAVINRQEPGRADDRYLIHVTDNCRSRNCTRCADHRFKRAWVPYYLYFKDNPPRVWARHLILTFRPVPGGEYSNKKLREEKRAVSKFATWMRRTNPKLWGAYALEPKYRPERDELTPHAHVGVTGRLPDLEKMRERWAAYGGGILKLAGLSEEREMRENEARGRRPLTMKQWPAMIKYMMKRAAWAGLCEFATEAEARIYSNDIFEDTNKRSRSYYTPMPLSIWAGLERSRFFSWFGGRGKSLKSSIRSHNSRIKLEEKYRYLTVKIKIYNKPEGEKPTWNPPPPLDEYVLLFWGRFDELLLDPYMMVEGAASIAWDDVERLLGVIV